MFISNRDFNLIILSIIFLEIGVLALSVGLIRNAIHIRELVEALDLLRKAMPTSTP